MKRGAIGTLGALTLGIRVALAMAALLPMAAGAGTNGSTTVSTGATADASRASVWVYVYADNAVVAGARIEVDGKSAGTTNAQGGLGTYVGAGEHRLRVIRNDDDAVDVELAVVNGEQLQVLVSTFAQRAPVYTIKSSISGERTIDTAPAVAPATADSAAEGAAGDAGDSAVADEGAATPEDTGVSASATTLSGVEVTGQGVRLDDQAAYTEEKRATAQVSEAISAEQIARAGDTDTAGALKRVTGLTLVDNRYIYVRGLGERYSSVLLNGAQIPSPDPTRRVVPLDLFPTDILEGIIVQKTYSPEMPGEFGGGTVQLRLKSMPDEFFIKLSTTLGFLDGTTFSDGLRYDGGDSDWTGYDDGAREVPDSLAQATANGRFLRSQSPLNPNGATPEQIEQYGEDLAGDSDVRKSNIGPNGSFSGTVGDVFKFGEDRRFGYVAAVRYNNGWDSDDEIRRTFVNSNAGLDLDNDLAVNDTRRDIDLSGFLSFGLDLGADHHLKAASTLLRQTQDRTKVSTGIDDQQPTRITELEWVENELRTTQLSGDHRIPELHDLGITWQYTWSKAGREAPNKRRYRYDLGPDGVYRFSTRSDSNLVQFADLNDDGRNWTLGFTSPWNIGDGASLNLSAGIDRVTRDRDSSIRSFTFQGVGVLARNPDLLVLPIDQILTPGNIGPDGFVLTETTRATDNYFATQSVMAQYLNADWTVYDKYRISAGARREHNDQSVTTFSLSNPNADPVVASDLQSKVLPAISGTWFIDADSQLRFAFSKTLSRPDFRELSPAPFTDPLLDAETIGNPDLKTTGIKNYDLRYEYYFSPTESVSVAAFLKDFVDPIEKVRLAGSGVLLGLQNAETGRNYGIELDAFKQLAQLADWDWSGRWNDAVGGWENYYVGFNYARIKSKVNLDPLQSSFLTNQERPLQGQSPYVTNLQIGYLAPDHSRELTVLYNVFGERIAQVGVQGQPDIYEQPFGQLDLVFRQDFAQDWSFKLRLRNLLDPDAELTQGDKTTRRFSKGREVLFTIDWVPTR